MAQQLANPGTGIRTLGVDLGWPGGLAVIDIEERLLHFEPVPATRQQHLRYLERVQGVIVRFACYEVATEKIAYAWGDRRIATSQREQQGLVKTAVQGAYRELGRRVKREIRTLGAGALRKAVLGGYGGTAESPRSANGRTSKRRMERMIAHIYPEVAKETEHVQDAVAIALTAVRHLRWELKQAQQEELTFGGRRKPNRGLELLREAGIHL